MDKGFSTLIVPVQEHFLRSTRHQLSIPDEKPGLRCVPQSAAMLRSYVASSQIGDDPPGRADVGLGTVRIA
jgi:hypothetical protein